MFAFLKEEVKEAALWFKSLVVSFLKWIFRWVLRVGMLAAVLMLAGKGCLRFLDKAEPLPNVSRPNLAQRAQDFVTSQVPTLDSSNRIPNGYSNPVPDRSNVVEVRSIWSTVNGIAGDLTRLFRKR